MSHLLHGHWEKLGYRRAFGVFCGLNQSEYTLGIVAGLSNDAVLALRGLAQDLQGEVLSGHRGVDECEEE